MVYLLVEWLSLVAARQDPRRDGVPRLDTGCDSQDESEMCWWTYHVVGHLPPHILHTLYVLDRCPERVYLVAVHVCRGCTT